jgi:aspartyl-tRNA(Asn)/glutamyl-tRNA(Gln) amidotransferase subunit A
MRTLASLAAALYAGTITSRALVEDCLRHIADVHGEGSRAFTKVYADAARADADRQDAARRGGMPASPLAGIPGALGADRRLLAVAAAAEVHVSPVLEER